ncbi:MAG: hypothetical protein GEV12_16175 [Micromonosporaceae bacterium]|nr:hypothetical protein [Micromonosporaceae bacterium]
METGTTSSQARIDEVVAEAADRDLVVVSTMNAASVDVDTGQPTASAAAQQALVSALLATGRPVVISGMRNPYDISHLTEAPTYLVTYGFTAASMESLTRVLFGEVDPVGKLPGSNPGTSTDDKRLVTGLWPAAVVGSQPLTGWGCMDGLRHAGWAGR